MRDLIIIGSGAAGLSAAVFALGKQLDVVAIYEDVGGKAGTQQVETQRHGVLTATAVIVATGASPLPLDVPGAKALLNHGIGYSITTHTQLVAGKRVAVIGTTRRALRGVIELARSAAQIYLIAPDATNLTSALARTVAAEPNVQLLANYRVIEIAGRESVESVAVERDGEQSWLRVDAVFADLGLLPNSGIARRIAQVDPDGFILVDDTNATTLPGLFAAGDVTSTFGENILIAIGDGARAAAGAYEYILARPRQPEAEGAD